MSTIEATAKLIARNQPAMLLTGAGISTDSGIPAYRNDRGEWSHPPPVQAKSFYNELHTRQRYWARSMAGWPRIAGARPNPAHLACATLQKTGFASSLITQNVDGLHQRAGSMGVTDLHGNLANVRCVECHTTQSRAEVQQRLLAANPDQPQGIAAAGPDGDSVIDTVCERFIVPECLACGGIIKPDVVFFGENVPAERVEHCFEQLSRSRVLVCVGTSLMVYSGYRFCRAAKEQQKPIAIINQGKTRADDIATEKLELDCSAALTAIVRLLCKTRSS